jgi:hypothetical protein
VLVAVWAAAAACAQPRWLAEINLYRAASGLAPVTAQPAWDGALLRHLVYLERTDASLMSGPFSSLHTENPASPYYSTAGAAEAASSDIALGGVQTGVQAVDRWFVAPFHAVGMLRPALRRVALGLDSPGGAAALDVLHGLDSTVPRPRRPVLFPGPGMTTGLDRYSGDETPDPLSACGWSGPAGLPLIALLPWSPAARASAVLSGPGGSGAQLCIVDEHTYPGGGDRILRYDRAVFLIPRHPLTGGTYRARLLEPGHRPVAWSFTVAPAASAAGIARRAPACTTRQHPRRSRVLSRGACPACTTRQRSRPLRRLSCSARSSSRSAPRSTFDW